MNRYSRILLVLACLAALPLPLSAQEASADAANAKPDTHTSDTNATDSSTPKEAPKATKDAVKKSADDSKADADKSDATDEGGYKNKDEKEFKPSEEIPADQAIAFPTDI